MDEISQSSPIAFKLYNLIEQYPLIIGLLCSLTALFVCYKVFCKQAFTVFLALPVCKYCSRGDVILECDLLDKLKQVQFNVFGRNDVTIYRLEKMLAAADAQLLLLREQLARSSWSALFEMVGNNYEFILGFFTGLLIGYLVFLFRLYHKSKQL